MSEADGELLLRHSVRFLRRRTQDRSRYIPESSSVPRAEQEEVDVPSYSCRSVLSRSSELAVSRVFFTSTGEERERTRRSHTYERGGVSWKSVQKVGPTYQAILICTWPGFGRGTSTSSIRMSLAP